MASTFSNRSISSLKSMMEEALPGIVGVGVAPRQRAGEGGGVQGPLTEEEQTVQEQQGQKHGDADDQGQEPTADAEGCHALPIQHPAHAVLPAAAEAAHEEGGHGHGQQEVQEAVEDGLGQVFGEDVFEELRKGRVVLQEVHHDQQGDQGQTQAQQHQQSHLEPVPLAVAGEGGCEEGAKLREGHEDIRLEGFGDEHVSQPLLGGVAPGTVDPVAPQEHSEPPGEEADRAVVGQEVCEEEQEPYRPDAPGPSARPALKVPRRQAVKDEAVDKAQQGPVMDLEPAHQVAQGQQREGQHPVPKGHGGLLR